MRCGARAAAGLPDWAPRHGCVDPPLAAVQNGPLRREEVRWRRSRSVRSRTVPIRSPGSRRSSTPRGRCRRLTRIRSTSVSVGIRRRSRFATARTRKSAFRRTGTCACRGAALPAGVSAAGPGGRGGVYGAYEWALFGIEAGARHGREWRVCDGLAAAEAAGTRPQTLAGVGKIVFAEIYDFSILQFLIATSLIRLVGDAELVAFAHAENVDATRFLDRTWNRFVGDEAIADQVLPSFVERGGRGGSLAAALGREFATERPAPAVPDGSIRVVVAPSRYREVEAAGRAIRARLERGAPPERIAFPPRALAVSGDRLQAA